MRVKKVMLNLRPKDRVNQSLGYDASPDTADCEFALSKPIHLKSEGHFYLRSAYFPISFKNVVEGYNDRFAIVFRPATTSTDDKSVWATVQIPVGHYNTLTDLATAINAQLAKLATTDFGTITSAGGVAFSYTNSYTGKLLNAAMTCTVSTAAATKNHLVFTLADTDFHNGGIETKDGTTLTSLGATTHNGGFQIVFGLLGSPVNNINGRTAEKLLGFGNEKKQLDGNNYPFSPSTVFDSTSSTQTLNSDSIGNVLLTPYIYVRCDLARQSVETFNKTSKQTDLIGKIPLVSSTYGSVLYYEADNNPLEFLLADGTIQNVRIYMTDADGRRLELGDNEWELALVFEGLVD